MAVNLEFRVCEVSGIQDGDGQYFVLPGLWGIQLWQSCIPVSYKEGSHVPSIYQITYHPIPQDKQSVPGKRIWWRGLMFLWPFIADTII